MKLLYHTDGDVNDVLDLYVEAGIDALHPLEVKAGMDLSRVVTSHGEHMAFFGNIDCRILASNDLVAIESEMKTKLEAGKEGRGYFYHCDHSIPPQVTPATYTLLIELLDRHGRYA